MSTKRVATLESIQLALGSNWTPRPGDPDAASVALAVTVALLRALRDRGLLSDGEIDDLFGDAAEHFRDAAALRLLNSVRAEVESKDEE
jgi:hypothetical protein